jgi:CheY-like chemotaxis protein
LSPYEASGKRQAEAAAALAAAAVSHPEAGASPEANARDARAAAQVVAEIVTPRMIRRAGRATVLWVDDRPSNNVHERQALEALGVTFVLATSTDEALEKFKYQSFDAIISDMGRPPDSEAGYTLLDALRKNGNQTPFIIYAGSRAPEHRAEARRRGAVGCTNRPDEYSKRFSPRWDEEAKPNTGWSRPRQRLQAPQLNSVRWADGP